MKVYALLKVVMPMMIMTDIQKKKNIRDCTYTREKKHLSDLLPLK